MGPSVYAKRMETGCQTVLRKDNPSLTLPDTKNTGKNNINTSNTLMLIFKLKALSRRGYKSGN